MATKSAPYKLTFSSTRATKSAATLKQAIKDAKYWHDFGVMRVCIHRRLPSGDYEQVKCVSRKPRKGKR